MSQNIHLARPDIQDIFSTLPNTGTGMIYKTALDSLNTYFVPQVNTAQHLPTRRFTSSVRNCATIFYMSQTDNKRL